MSQFFLFVVIIENGDEIEVVCDGVDEEEALKAVIAGIENGLGE